MHLTSLTIGHFLGENGGNGTQYWRTLVEGWLSHGYALPVKLNVMLSEHQFLSVTS